MQIHIKSLTGVRAIAAYMVFLHHFNFFKNYESLKLISQIVDEFHIGVTIFFVLSGFLIYYRYFDQIKNDTFSWWVYVKNRVARIYPMYFILTTITFIVASIYHEYPMYSSKETFLVYILNVSFLRGFFDNFKFSGIIQGWSLTVEECFYFSAPIIFLFLKNKWRVLPILIIYGIGITLTLIFMNFNFYGFFSNYNFLFGFTFFGRVFEFFSGMGLAFIILKKPQVYRKGFLITMAGGISILLCAFILSLIKLHFSVQQGPFHPWGRVINNLILPIAIVTFFFGIIIERNLFSRLLSTDLFQLIGKSSYVFYLIHLGVFYDLIVYVFPKEHYLLSFILLNILAIIFYKYVEEPINKKIRTFKLIRLRVGK